MPRRPEPEPAAAELAPLLRAIGARDTGAASKLLRASPELARSALELGATRQQARPYYFEAIHHYAYAGDTALHLAAAAHERKLAEQLLANGANARARNRRGAEPLHYACDGAPGSEAWDPAAQARLVQLLLGAGASADALDKSGVAPLHRAVRTRSSGAVRALLSGGAGVTILNGGGSSPLHLAVQDTGRGGSGSSAARAAQTEIIQLLLLHGARPSDRSATGKTVLACAKAAWIRELLCV